MARKPRLHYAGALYHVMVRGNGGQDIFADDEDRCRFYLFLQEGVEKFGHRVHAFCLMKNHVAGPGFAILLLLWGWARDGRLTAVNGEA